MLQQPECQQEPEHNSWFLPTSLKGKLSTSWSRRLQSLAVTKVVHQYWKCGDLGTFVEESRTASSWEDVLQVLGQEDAVEICGELKLVPAFLTLPVVLQTRFLFLLWSDLSKISSRSAHSFLNSIKDHKSQNLWLKETLHLFHGFLKEDGAASDEPGIHNGPKYEFTASSQMLLQDIVGKVRGGKQEYGRQDENTDAEEIKDKEQLLSGTLDTVTEATSIGQEFVQASISGETLHLAVIDESSNKKEHTGTGVVNVDVIVIDDNDDDDDCFGLNPPSEKFHVGDKNLPRGLHEKSESVHLTEKCNTDFIQQNNAAQFDQKSMTRPICEVDEGSHTLTDTKMIGKLTGVDPFENMTARKRKRTDKGVADTSFEDKDSVENIIEPVQKSQKLEDDDPTCNLECKNETVIKDGEHEESESFLVDATEECDMPENVKVLLSSLKEALPDKDKESAITSEMLSCLQDMDTMAMEAACTYLKLASISERALVNLCDNVPWSRLEGGTARVLLSHCYHQKLRNLQGKASQTLLASVNSVTKSQPLVLLDIVTQVIHETSSGEYPCQFLTTLCKESLPHDCLGHIIRKLSVQGFVMNENLATVLQTLLDRRVDLDQDSLTQLFSLLASASSEMLSGPKLGKILLGILTKHGKKMSTLQLTTVGTLVDANNSSFRRSLQNAVKRLS